MMSGFFRVSWCFTPSQPVRLYQSKVSLDLIYGNVSSFLHPYLLMPNVKDFPFSHHVRFSVTRPYCGCCIVSAFSNEKGTEPKRITGPVDRN